MVVAGWYCVLRYDMVCVRTMLCPKSFDPSSKLLSKTN